MEADTSQGREAADTSVQSTAGPESSAGAAEASPSSGKPRKAFEIDVFRGWCKSCGICAAFCPRKCIEVDEDGSPVVSHCDRCTGCGWCELHCPDFAISVHPKESSFREEEE